jgi:hypothetical protein
VIFWWQITLSLSAVLLPLTALPQRRHLTTAAVLANPIEAANRFFAGLNPILKTAGPIEQQEILISRTECRLL